MKYNIAAIKVHWIFRQRSKSIINVKDVPFLFAVSIYFFHLLKMVPKKKKTNEVLYVVAYKEMWFSPIKDTKDIYIDLNDGWLIKYYSF